MDEVMRGEVSTARLAAALAALRVRGETPEEIAGFGESMRHNAIQLPLNPAQRGEVLLDTVGTGGDGANILPPPPL